MLRSRSCLFALLFGFMACGGESPKAKDPKPSPVATAATEEKRETATEQQLGESARREFMGGCNVAPGTEDYCECAWKVFRKHVTIEELRAEQLTPRTSELFNREARISCMSKMPDEVMLKNVVDHCVGEGESANSAKRPFCTCRWTELRKVFSKEEFNDEATLTTERFRTANVGAAKKCGPQLPDAVVEEEFMKGCATKTEAKPLCTCTWKALRKRYSASEIESQVPDKAEVTKLATACRSGK